MSFPKILLITPYSKPRGFAAFLKLVCLRLSLGHEKISVFLGSDIEMKYVIRQGDIDFVEEFDQARLIVVSRVSDVEVEWIRKVDVVILTGQSTVSDLLFLRKQKNQAQFRGVDQQNIFAWVLHQKEFGFPKELIAETVQKYSLIPFNSDLFQQIEEEGGFKLALFPKKIISALDENLQQIQSAKNNSSSLKNSDGKLNAQDVFKKVIHLFWEKKIDLKDSMSSVGETIKSFIAEVLAGEGHQFSLEEIDELENKVRAHVMGFGPLEEFFKDENITEVMVNGPHQIYLEKYGEIKESIEGFQNDRQLQMVIERLVSSVGRRVDTSSPICDLRVQNGARANIVLPPLSLQGPLLTIRRFKPSVNSFEDLLRRESITESQIQYLKRKVMEKENILIAGNSGSGKTTLLNILSQYIHDGERIISMEDAAELQIQKSHVIRLETRPKNAEGIGEITMNDLVVNALRMRPDRLIVGECRGVEVLSMLQAMNTGHDGSMTTIHANSAQDALHRLEMMILLGAPQWPLNVIREQIASAIDVIVFLKRDGVSRKVLSMGSIEYVDGELSVRCEC